MDLYCQTFAIFFKNVINELEYLAPLKVLYALDVNKREVSIDF